MATAKPLPTEPGATFRARVTRGTETREVDVMVAQYEWGQIRYVSAQHVDGLFFHLASYVEALDGGE